MTDNICELNYYCIYCNYYGTVDFNFDINYLDDKPMLMDRFCPVCGSPHTILINFESELKSQIKMKMSILNSIREKRKIFSEDMKKELDNEDAKFKNQKTAKLLELAELQDDIAAYNNKLSELKKIYSEVEKKNEVLKNKLQIYLNEEIQQDEVISELIDKGGTKLYNHYINANSKEEREKISRVGREMHFDTVYGTEGEFVLSESPKTCCFYVRTLEEEKRFELYPNTMIKFPVGQEIFCDFFDIEGSGFNVELLKPCTAVFDGNVYKIEEYGIIALT